mmetsp:Transcript_12231/g.12045  ORF Transcript_12231/g.12045 Transcript_12231/m.12045 type:complete len:81 (+) Transcript_12231:69-311(+)
MVCEELIRKTVKRVPQPWHIILFIINIILPGWGTMISACCGSDLDVFTILVGLVQLFTAWLLIGWLWSIYWGYLIFKKGS